MTERWLAGRPDETIRSADVTLTRARLDDVDDLVAAVNSSLDELRPWMPWAQVPATPASIGEFLERAVANWEAGHEFQFAIRGASSGGSVGVNDGGETGALVGFCGLHDRVGPGGLEIGYWVRSDHTGRGLATAAASALTSSALGLQGVSRVEIHCDAANLGSAAIPNKLGYRLDRVENRPPAAPGETARHMIWVFGPGAGPGRS
jgi:RimJ/RimL family protein N-acetyltransferase